MDISPPPARDLAGSILECINFLDRFFFAIVMIWIFILVLHTYTRQLTLVGLGISEIYTSL